MLPDFHPALLFHGQAAQDGEWQVGHTSETKHICIWLLLLPLLEAEFGVTWLCSWAQRALGKN